jgi:peptide/nickel transport system permease protein
LLDMTHTANIEKMLGGRRREWHQRLRGLAQELWRDKAGFIGMLMIAGLISMALAAPVLAPYDPAAQDLRARLKPPAWAEKGTWKNVLGTDHLGRDVLSRVIYGSRVSLLVGTAVVLAAGTLSYCHSMDGWSTAA